MVRRVVNAAEFLTVLFATSPLIVHAMTFTPLGDLPGGTYGSSVEAVSDDGLTAVGSSSQSSGSAPFRWTSANGMIAITGSDSSAFPGAFGVSADGAVVVGVWGTPLSEHLIGESFRWTATGGMQGLGDLPGGWYASRAWGVSGDGSVVVGTNTSSAQLYQGYRWTQSTGMIGLGDLAGGDFKSHAFDVSADGLVIVGDATSNSGVSASRWTSATGWVSLGFLPGGAFSGAYAVSSDGTVIAGGSQSGSGDEAFRWTAASGMTGLGDLPGGSFSSIAYDVSADGNVVVGSGHSASAVQFGAEAFYWTEATGMLNVKQLLIDNGVAGLANWTLTDAKGVSADGKILVGNGVNPSGQSEAWIANISKAGDYDGDFDVDGNDYLKWRQNFGSMLDLAADGSGNGIVDAADYVVWRDHYGASSASASSAVPEPATAFLLVIAVACLVVRKERLRAP